MFDDVNERYNRDPEFHALVDMMTNYLLHAVFSPNDLRRAAIYAETRFFFLQAPRRFQVCRTCGGITPAGNRCPECPL